MPKGEDGFYVDQLQTMTAFAEDIQAAEAGTREAVGQLTLPDGAKLLTAIALELMSSVQARNDREDVNDACAVLRAAIRALEEMDPTLDG